MTPPLRRPLYGYASIKQTPRGSVVVSGDHLLTDELTTEDAYALAARINQRLIDAAYRNVLAWT